MENTIKKLSYELDMPIEEIMKVYNSYWKFIRTKIEELPLKKELSEEDFNKLRTNFNIINLGKLHCTYKRYRIMQNRWERIKNVKHKENKINS